MSLLGAQLAYRQCPKCKSFSGDDWSQCKTFCPVEGSPHFYPLAQEQYGPAIEMTREQMQAVERERMAVTRLDDGEIPF
jgi:hypothetical protein